MVLPSNLWYFQIIERFCEYREKKGFENTQEETKNKKVAREVSMTRRHVQLIPDSDFNTWKFFVQKAEVYIPIPGVWSGSIPARTAGLVPLQTPLVGTGTNPAVPTGTGLLTKQQSTCKWGNTVLYYQLNDQNGKKINTGPVTPCVLT